MFTSTIMVCRPRWIRITTRVKGEIDSMENRHREFLTAAIVRAPEAAR